LRRIVDGRTSCVDGRQAEIVLKRVHAACIVPNIDAGRRGIIDGHLHGRVSDDDVPTYEVPLSFSANEDSIRIPDDGVVDDHVVVRTYARETDAKVITWGRVSVSAQPVRTEPVTACAVGQSYAAARSRAVPVSHGNIGFQLVVRRPVTNPKSRSAVGRCSDLCHENPGTSVDDDSLVAKPLYDAGSLNDHSPKIIDENSVLSRRLGATAPRDSVSLSGNREPIKPQCHP